MRKLKLLLAAAVATLAVALPSTAGAVSGDYCGTADGGFVNYSGLVVFDRWAGDNWVITPGADPNATGVEHLVSRHYNLFVVHFGWAGAEDVNCWIYW